MPLPGDSHYTLCSGWLTIYADVSNALFMHIYEHTMSECLLSSRVVVYVLTDCKDYGQLDC